MRSWPVLAAFLALHGTAVADDRDLPQRGAGTGCVPAAAAPAARAAADGPTVSGELERAGLPPEQRAAYADLYRRSRALRDDLPAARGRELGAVVAGVESLARRRLLTASRARLAFEQLERNADWWARSGPPAAPRPARGSRSPCAGGAGLGGARVTVDGAVLQWYPGQGLQVQQLATAGRVNALAQACLPADPQAPPGAAPCRPEQLREALDAVRRLAVDRGDHVAWEYLVAFGGGRGPWASGMAQATAMQALVRGGQALGEPAYAQLALRGLGLFERRPPAGVRARGLGGADAPHFLLYSFNPGLRVFNAFLQTLIGLHEVAERTGDPRARALFAAGDREARREVPLADTGAWSRYSLRGAESDLGYHRLVRDFLRRLCDRTQGAVYCTTAERFTGYLREPVTLRLTPDRRAVLSKVSCVTLRVRRGGRTLTTVSKVLQGGEHALPWTPPAAGRYVLDVVAEDLAGHRVRAERAVTVRR